MFASLPNTLEVRKARRELLQMMEDKYNELLEEGVSENAAIGTVISEFGNLDELADDLGLTEEIKNLTEEEANVRYIKQEEVDSYIADRTKFSFVRSLGIFLCITSVSMPVLFDNIMDDIPGIALMFLAIALGVGCIVYSGFFMSSWQFLKNEPCKTDMGTASYIKNKEQRFEPKKALYITLGIILCILCWLPCLLFEHSYENLGPALMFPIVGVGVFLIVYGNGISAGFKKLLELGSSSKIYNDHPNIPKRYKNKTAESVLLLYWPTVTCLYLILSFLTFSWHITWVIWVIAGVLHKAVEIQCLESEE